MKIYLDIFFLINAGMNFAVLMMESFFQKKRIHLFRLLGASVLGGFLVTLFIISGIHRYLFLSFLVYAAGSAILVRIAFGKTTVRTWAKNFVLFYFTAFLLSGMLQYLQNVVHRPGSMFWIVSGTGGAMYILYRFLPIIRKYERRNKEYIKVRLWYRGGKVQGNGLLDTGNQLIDPFSGSPVVISGFNFVAPLFGREEPLFRYIPFHAIGTEHGTLRAFQAEYLEMQTGEGIWKQVERPWIAVYDNPVSADGEYELILHPDLVANK